ncbi:MAG: GNAT family N-acetyltransferase [Candidatus Eremiobacteraeota bacterium]|nr:GNAT family N-acetyltransferase [Candidatus Eremiobacteraeota bacterium]
MKDGYTVLPAGKLANVVTDFEMLERPEIQPDRTTRHLTLQRWEGPEIGRYRELFVAIGAPWLWFSRLVLTDEALAAILNDPDDEVYLAREGDRDVGFFELDFRQRGECELRFFGLIPDAIGSGVGRWLMNRAVEHAWSRPIRRFWLHTCTLDHPDALAFYARSGFRPFRRQIEISDDPRLVGLLPRSAAPQVPLIEGGAS